jgi:hypothetical protein
MDKQIVIIKGNTVVVRDRGRINVVVELLLEVGHQTGIGITFKLTFAEFQQRDRKRKITCTGNIMQDATHIMSLIQGKV